MATIVRNNILFLHIPKTGGNWLTRVFEQENLVVKSIGHKHATYDYLLKPTRKRNPKRPDRIPLLDRLTARRHLSSTPTVLCVVRNPISWYESWYKFQTGNQWREWGENGNMEFWHACASLNGIKGGTFSEFMRNVNFQRPGFLTQFFGRYTQGANAHTLRNEYLDTDFVKFCDDVGLKVDRNRVLAMPRIGESKSAEIEWEESVLLETIELERACFVQYGYEIPSR